MTELRITDSAGMELASYSGVAIVDEAGIAVAKDSAGETLAKLCLDEGQVGPVFHGTRVYSSARQVWDTRTAKQRAADDRAADAEDTEDTEETDG